MACILLIETTGEICSVAISKDNKCLAFRESTEKNTHTQYLLPFVDELLQEAGISRKELEAVAISSGPGSYTGLRIGTSTAKAICFSLNIPLIAINTLKALASAALEQLEDQPKAIIPMIDARRKEVYTAVYDHELKLIEEQQAIDFKKSEWNFPSQAVYVGNGIQKMEDEIKASDSIMLNNINLSSKNMIYLADIAFSIRDFANIPYFVPNYIKNFQLFK